MNRSTESQCVVFCVLFALCCDNQQCPKKKLPWQLASQRRMSAAEWHPTLDAHEAWERVISWGLRITEFVFDATGQCGLSVSCKMSISTPSYIHEGCGLQVGIWKLEASFLAALGPLLKIRRHYFSAMEKAHTLHPHCSSGTQPCSPGCDPSQIIQSPVSLQGTRGVAPITPWSLDIIRTSFRCSRNKLKDSTPKLSFWKPYYVKV